MPYAHSKKGVLIPRSLDRRVRVTETLRLQIKNLYFFERLSQRAIARETGLSRRTVNYTLFPDQYALLRQAFKERRKDGRYRPERKAWADTAREHRHYKQKLALQNKLIKKP